MTRPSRLIRAIPRAHAGGIETDDGGSVQEDLDTFATYMTDDRWKQPAVAATTGNITIATALNSGDTLDGVTLADGDRVLVKDQSTDSQNGIYVVSSSPTRAEDFNGSTEVLGSVVHVIAGTANAGTTWFLDITSIPVIGTDPLTFTEMSGGGGGSSEYPRPLMAFDPDLDMWFVVVDLDGTAVMVTGGP